MKAVLDPDCVLAKGLAAIRSQYQVPTSFPQPVLEAAEAAARRLPTEHVDRTDIPFVTLDPASATDLDQALWVEPSGSDLLLRYAIADVAWFVEDGDPVDAEAWHRGTTLYLPDGKASLYPPVLSEGAASLLPDGPRPAVLFTVRVGPDGAVKLEGAERALVRSRAKLAYETVTDADLPPQFAELARRIAAAEAERGASRVDPPEQEVARRPDGGYALAFRARHASEDQNAALSLAANLAIADVLRAHHTGLFRVMAEPDAGAVARLRNTASALGIAWPEAQSLAVFRTGLDPADPHQAALMLAIRKAGQGASYAPWRGDVLPWHAAVAASYVHATAPLRRLADRYVIRATLAIMSGQPVPDVVEQAFERLPKVMGRADALGGQIDRAVIDLAEAVMLDGREGETFAAVVTDVDVRGARMQLADLPVVTRIDAPGAAPGTALSVRLVDADPAKRTLRFEAIGSQP
ncbi:RNB domain-containing ribonuclease [Sphingomonas sp. R-74633]|uniref:RNB domain-containing ribonuclease n=1 Tax=Sphingomonas sp. R-74633 TaxID=2751188 RepID=UPI0015D124EB|nr:RNB domain-containing ribonuclease [Sphingomonas sp. R-74633]NYT40159.1 RNB domain-containing ribonuclease [Sphingomonas sp. R-74633]